MIPSQSRLESISDGIFAFAATLVVVSLDVPDSYAELRESLGKIFSFAISFAALVLLWVTHHNYFRRINGIDNWIIAYNFGMLFVMLCYVFPLKFLTSLAFGHATIANYAEFTELFIVYGLGFTLLFFFVALLYRRAARREPARAAYLHYWKRHFFIFVGVGLLSILIAWLGVGARLGLSGIIYSLLGPLCYWHGKKTGVDDPGEVKSVFPASIHLGEDAGAKEVEG